MKKFQKIEKNCCAYQKKQYFCTRFPRGWVKRG